MKSLNHTRLIYVTTTAAFALFAAIDAFADQPASAKTSPVLKAAFNDSTAREGLQRVTFSKRPAQVGDEVEQTLALAMHMTTTLRQGNQIGKRTRTTARNDQRRVVTTMQVESDRAVAVRVRYLDASKQLDADNSTTQQKQPPRDSAPVAQPVAGKTYLCQRQPGKDGPLTITDEAGNVPPKDEYEIAAQHMAMVGRPNPLAELLAGQSLAIGQTISLPPQLAGKIFSLGEQFDEVTRFELVLQGVKFLDNATCAEFLARVDAVSSSASQMRMQLEGPLTVHADTCRAVKVDLGGPIAMSEMRGSYSTSYQVIGTGQLKMNVASTYRDVTR
jgi:hypothetical protein